MEWTHTGLKFSCKRIRENNQTLEDTKRRRGKRGGRGGSAGDGGMNNLTPPPGTGRGLGRRSRTEGVGAGRRAMKAGSGRERPLYMRTPWLTRT